MLDLLRRYAHLDERDDPRTIRAKVTGQLLTLDEALQDAIPPLLALLDTLPDDSPFLALDPPQRRQRTLTALKRVLLRESQVQPVLVVFEDLHWIDTETQALLDSLVESLPTAGPLLLVNYRPEYQHGWGSKTYYEQLRLDPLPPASADAFLHALLGDDSSLEPLTQLLIVRTEGNPFFLEESMRTLIETGVLVGERGVYRLVTPLDSLQVPATVQAVLAARIDRLPPEDKRLLQTAAVIGTKVLWPLLQAIAEVPEEELHRGLGQLQAAEFLYETSLYLEREYTFKHALTHEVAYGSLLQERRRVLHARIVEALEALAGERVAEQVDRLAHHALRGEVWDKALAYSRQAGEKALGRSAHREAAACFEQALDALTHLPESRDLIEQDIDLRFDLRKALHPLGAHRQILDHLRAAETLAEALNDHRRLGWNAVCMSNYCWWMGKQDQAIKSGKSALAMNAVLGDFTLQIMTNFRLGQAYLALGDYRQAIDFLMKNVIALEGEHVLQHFGLAGLASVLSRTMLVWAFAECGNFVEGRGRAEEGIRIAEAVDPPFSRIMAYVGAGMVALRQGDPYKASPVLERGLDVCHSHDIPVFFAWVASLLGYAYALLGRMTEALPLLEQAVEHMASVSVKFSYALWVALLGEAYLLTGRLEEALVHAERALDLSRAHKEQGHEAWTLRLLGEIAAQRKPPEVEEAESHYQQALALAEELGMRPLQAHCHCGLGTLYAAIGRPEQARAELDTAIELYHAMDMTFWLPQAEAALAQVKGR
jgi:tetratricopeptide (TPR) repeat protein